METTIPTRISVVSDSDRLHLKPTGQKNEWLILDRHADQQLGLLSQTPDSPYDVELFWGKGGFMAVLRSANSPVYFALPGSSVKVAGTSVYLTGPVPPDGQLEIVLPSRGAFSAQGQSETSQAMILGAGLATRFERISGQHTHYSKPAVPLVGNRSVIRCLADLLASHGYTRLLINTYFKPESLKAGLCFESSNGNGKNREVHYINENEPSGTAGALRKILTQTEYAHFLDESKPLLVVQGDSVTDADFSALMRAHAEYDALVTLGCQQVANEDVDKFGIIVTDRSGDPSQDPSGNILEFQEKPSLAQAKSRLGNTGFYIFSPRSFPLIREIYQEHLSRAQAEAIREGRPVPEEVSLDFAHDIFPRLLDKVQANPKLGPFRAQQVKAYWNDIGNPSQYLQSVRDVYSGKVAIPLPDDAHRYYRNGIVYWEGAQELAEKDGAQLSGNVVVALPFMPSSSLN